MSQIAKFENWLVEKYSSTPYVQALAGFVVGAVSTAAGANPILAGIAGTTLILIDSGFRDMVHKRQEILFDELAKGEHLLSEDIIRKEEFLHAFSITYRAAIRTYQTEKIRRLGKLLISSVEKQSYDTETFENFIRVGEELSDTELTILVTLNRYEKQFPPNDGSDMRGSEDFWDDFETEIANSINITKQQLVPILLSLGRLGIYQLAVGGFGNPRAIGWTTQLFEEFIDWLSKQDTIDK